MPIDTYLCTWTFFINSKYSLAFSFTFPSTPVMADLSRHFREKKKEKETHNKSKKRTTDRSYGNVSTISVFK